MGLEPLPRGQNRQARPEVQRATIATASSTLKNVQVKYEEIVAN